MKYFKDRVHNPFEAENESEEEIVNELNSLGDLDAQARARGEKLANEWTRRDFAGLLKNHKELRLLNTSEIRALFLVPVSIGDAGIYYRRGNVRDVRRHRANGGAPLYHLAEARIDVNDAKNNPEVARDLAILRERGKLDAIWEKL